MKIITTNFTENGDPKAGLHPTITIYLLTSTASTVVVTADQMMEIGDGWYRYNFADYNPSNSYVFTIDGGNTLSQYERYKHGANESYAEDITTTVLDESIIDHTITGSVADTISKTKADTSSLLISEAAMVLLLNTLLKYQRNRTRIDTTNAQLIIYDDDGETPIMKFNLVDFTGMPNIQEVCERIPAI